MAKLFKHLFITHPSLSFLRQLTPLLHIFRCAPATAIQNATVTPDLHSIYSGLRLKCSLLPSVLCVRTKAKDAAHSVFLRYLEMLLAGLPMFLTKTAGRIFFPARVDAISTFTRGSGQNPGTRLAIIRSAVWQAYRTIKFVYGFQAAAPGTYPLRVRITSRFNNALPEMKKSVITLVLANNQI